MPVGLFSIVFLIAVSALVLSVVSTVQAYRTTPIPVTTVSDTTIQESGDATVPYKNFFPSAAVNVLYQQAFKSTPSIEIAAISNLTGQQCTPIISDQTKLGFSAGVLTCPPFGVQIGESDTYNKPNVSAFLVNGESRSGMAYMFQGKLYYQLALDKYGNSWTTPVRVDSNAIVNSFRMINVDNTPMFTWLEEQSNVYTFFFARGTDPQLTAYTISPTATAFTAPDIAYLVGDLAMIEGQPTVLLYRNSHPRCIMYCRSSDGGVTWPTTIGPGLVILDVNNDAQQAVLSVVSGNPAVAIVDNVPQLWYWRASNSTGSSWPVSATGPVYSNVQQNQGTLYLLNVDFSGTVYPVLCSQDTNVVRLFMLKADDATGSAWTGTPVSINSVNPDTTGGISPGSSTTGSYLVYQGNQIVISFNSGAQRFMYGIIPSSNFFSASDFNSYQNLSQTQPFGQDGVAMSFVGNSVSFSWVHHYVFNGQLFYFRPVGETPVVDLDTTIHYNAIGVKP